MNKLNAAKAKLKALQAELRIRNRNFNAADRDLMKCIRAIETVERKIENLMA